MTTRNDIIKHFKKLAEHSTFLQYAAESAERIGWALEVNLRDAAGRVILSLGSAPRECWSEAPPAVVAIDPDLFKRAGSDHPLRWGSLGQVDGHLIHRNGTSDGTGPARAARRARAEAAAAVTADAQAEHGAEEAALDACAAETSPSEKFSSGDYQPGDVFRSAKMAKAAETLERCMKNPLIAAAVAGNSDSVTAARMVDRAQSPADPVATASLSVEAMEPVRPDGALDPASLTYIGIWSRDGALAWMWHSPQTGCWGAIECVTRRSRWSWIRPSASGWTLVKQP